MSDDLKVAMTLEQCWHRVPGGTAVAGIEMARALDETEGIDIVGVAAAHTRPAPEPWTPPIEVHHLSLGRRALYESWHRLRAPKIERATGTVDVIHATTMAIPPRSVPLVVTVHDLAFIHYPDHFTRHGIRFFNRGLELARKEADIVVCPSQSTMADCEEAGFETGKLRLVPMGVRPRKVTKAEVAEVKAKYGVGAYILWTGTVEPRKNLPALISAFAEIAGDVSEDLVLVGPAGWHEDLAGLVPGDLEDRVRWTGFVPDSDLWALYSGASVFCYPSVLEGFGFPVLEAMAQGAPVVTSKGTSTEDIVGSAGVLVDPNDPSDIAGGIVKALADSAKLHRAGPQRARSFTWEKTARRLADCYRELAA